MNDKKRIGRPKGPEKVVWKRYATREEVELLDKVWRDRGRVGGSCMDLKVRESSDLKNHEQDEVGIDNAKVMELTNKAKELEELKKQLPKLLEDVDRLEKEVKLYETKRENWMRATVDQRVQAVWREVDKWKAAYLSDHPLPS